MRLYASSISRDAAGLGCPTAIHTPGRVHMTRNQHWFTVPHAVVLEATRDIELVVGLKDDDPDMLLMRANQLIAPRIFIPLEADADEDRQLEAVRKLQEEKTA